MMMKTLLNIPFHRPYVTDEDVANVVNALRSGWLTSGPKTLEFESKFREYIFGQGKGYAVAVNSATSALHLALKALGIKEGDEVLLPANTFVSTAEAVTYLGAVPVLCDIQEDTHNIDVSKIERLITSRTRALIPVHFGGQPCDMEEILDIARRHKLFVVEDAAHCLPSGYKGKRIGKIGDITCFSFYVTKTLCTGEGGMAVTDNEDYACSMRLNRLHGICTDSWGRGEVAKNWSYDVLERGFKYNMSDMNAALGVSQLKKLEWMHAQRERVSKKYDESFIGTKVLPVLIRADRQSSRHLYVIKVNNRDELIDRLKEKGIGTSVHFIPLHSFSYYKKAYRYTKKDFPVSERVFQKSLSLPIYPGLTDIEVEYTVENVLNYAK